MQNRQGKVNEIASLIKDFISGEDRSIGLAGKLEVALDEILEEDEIFEDLALALASYQPGGGEYLYSTEMLLQKCRAAAGKLDAMMEDNQDR